MKRAKAGETVGAVARNLGWVEQTLRSWVKAVDQAADEEGTGPWPTLRHARRSSGADLFDYMEVFFNRSRRYSTLGYQSPIQFLQHWIGTKAEPKLAA